MRILFLSRWFPYPPNNGSKLRIYNLLLGLAEQYDITLLSFADQPEATPDVFNLQPGCREIQVVPWKPFNPRSQRARLGLFSLAPRSFADTFSPEMAQRIEQNLASEKYSAVIASQIDMAVYSRYFSGVPAVFEEVEVGVLYEQFTRAISPLQRFRYGLTWFKYRRYLASLLRKFRLCTVVSRQEQQILQNVAPDYSSIEVVPNCVDVDGYKSTINTPHPNTLIFTGSFSYSPNYEAMVWFLGAVYSHIQAELPDVQLTITGDHGHRPLPENKGVTLTGFVDDVKTLIASSSASIVPLFTGGGTRLKILEAMALRTPVVTTSKGAEGLDVIPGEHVLIADAPDTFARATIRLLQEPELRRNLVDNAYRLVAQKYNWKTTLPRFVSLVERAAQDSDELSHTLHARKRGI